MRLVMRTSPNWNHRPPGVAVSCVVLHATADNDTQASVQWCCDKQSKVSYHTIIDRDGTVYALVESGKRAWHAGVSAFQGRDDVNDFSLGLSFANANDGHEAYTDVQYEVGASIVQGWLAQYPAITRDRITTHAAIALPKGRKTDPKGFDLERFLGLLDFPGNGS